MTITKVQNPPSYMTEPCEIPEAPVLSNNRDLLLYTLDLQYCLQMCAGKVDSLRMFFNGISIPDDSGNSIIFETKEK